MQPNDQSPPPASPDPTMPPIQPIRRTVIQPISSEDEIRQAAASSGAPARPSEPGVNPSAGYASEATAIESPEYENTYQGSLITEPIHRPNQAPAQYSVAQVASAAVEKKKPVAKVVTTIFALLVTGVLGVAGWVFLSGRVSPAELAQENVNIFNRESSVDLVQESLGQSTYLRPKDWSQTAYVNSYGNTKTKDEEPTALVTLNEFSPDSSLDALFKDRDELQRWYMEKLPDNVLLMAIYTNTPMDCNKDTFTVTRREDETKNDTTVGVISADASCEKEGGMITMKMRIVKGVNDGRERIIVVTATGLEWLKNEKTFQQMLDSVEERKAP